MAQDPVRVVGGGAAGALAGALLARLGYAVSWFEPANPSAASLHVLLPEGARRMLVSLGIEPPLRPIERSAVRGVPGLDALSPGGVVWHQVDEARLRQACVAALQAAGGRAIPEAAGLEGADLCGVAALFPPPQRPQRLFSSPARVLELDGVPESLLPPREHQMGLQPGGWTWAMRTDRVQVAGCGESAEDPALHHFGGWPEGWSRPRVTAELRVELSPSLPGEVGAALPLGRAAFAVSPLSSQGVAQSFATAQLVASVLHTLRRRPEDERALRAWLGEQLQLRAWRSHEGSRVIAEGVHRRFGSPFWGERAAVQPDLNPAIGRAVARSRAFAALQATGRTFDTPFVAAAPEPTRCLQPHGAVIRWAPAVQADALPVPDSLWQRARPLHAAFAEPATLAGVFERLSLGDEQARGATALVARLLEGGLLRTVEAASDPGP